jgi:hypothetical protein
MTVELKHMAGMTEKEVWVVRTEHAFVWTEVMILCVLQVQEFSWLAEQLLAALAWLCCMVVGN